MTRWCSVRLAIVRRVPRRNVEIKDDDLGFVASNQLVRPGQFPTQNLNDYNVMSVEKLIKR